MVYELLNDLRDYMACNADHESNSIEQGLLDRIEKVLKTVHRKDDTDFLMPNEILARICPGTNHPVLVCHTGDGYAVCLHNDTLEEDAEDVQQWLKSCGEVTSAPHTSVSNGYFPITTVHRADLEAQGLDIAQITDEQMQELAKRMANDYCEQLFWSSMTIIAEYMGLPKKREISDDDIYVLVEFPEDAAVFEEDNIGFPSWSSEDNGARYVPKKDYIKTFGKEPDEENCFCAVCWPDSQDYMELADDPDSRIELIQDESALEKFGSSAYWVPIGTEL